MSQSFDLTLSSYNKKYRARAHQYLVLVFAEYYQSVIVAQSFFRTKTQIARARSLARSPPIHDPDVLAGKRARGEIDVDSPL